MGLQNHVQSLLFWGLKSNKEPNIIQRTTQTECDNCGVCYEGPQRSRRPGSEGESTGQFAPTNLAN